MDLTKFTNSLPGKKSKEELIINNQEIKITKLDSKLKITIKKKEAIEKYQNFMFFAPTHSIITESEKEAQDFFNQSIKEGTEGLMFKNLNAPYKPGLRSGSMAKIKETKEDIDVVIIGAEHGKGKRAGFYSSFIVAVRNDNFSDESDKYLTIGKVSSGIKEIGDEGATLEKLTSLLKPLKISEEKGIIRIEPKIVMQVRYQEIQKSTIYDSGYALRFPRIISLREDKTLDEINTIEDIEHFIK